MEGNSSPNFPTDYVTLKDLKERWLKRKQDEEEERLRKIRQEEEAERLRKHRQDKEEKRLHNDRQGEENNSRRQKEYGNRPPKSKQLIRSARKTVPSPGGSASHGRRPAIRADRTTAACSGNEKVSDAIGAKSEPRKKINNRRKAINRRSNIDVIAQTVSHQSTANIEGKKAEKQEKRLEISEEQRAEIIQRVSKISVSSGSGGQRGVGRGDRRRGSRSRSTLAFEGMMWVRKTTDA